MPVIEIFLKVVRGDTGAVLCYGQTGSGKTHTMGLLGGQPQGPGHCEAADQRGIVPFCLAALLGGGSSSSTPKNVEVRLEFLQVYLDQVYDLFCAGKKLQLREVPGVGVMVEGSTLVEVESYADAAEILDLALRNRYVGEVHLRTSAGTPLAEIADHRHLGLHLAPRTDEDLKLLGLSKHLSSRSHVLLTLHVRQRGNNQVVDLHKDLDLEPGDERANKWSRLVLVDLAGSERTNVGGNLLEDQERKMSEAKAINASLAALGNVVNSLAKSKSQTSRGFVPWRESKLTKLLWDAMRWPSRVRVLCTVSRERHSVSETVSTLGFAARCKKIVQPRRAGLSASENGRACPPPGEEVTLLRAEVVKLREEKNQLERLVQSFLTTAAPPAAATAINLQDAAGAGAEPDAEGTASDPLRSWASLGLPKIVTDQTQFFDENSAVGALFLTSPPSPRGLTGPSTLPPPLSGSIDGVLASDPALGGKAKQVLDEIRGLRQYAAWQKNLSEDLIKHAAFSSMERRGMSPCCNSDRP
eukprot:g12002.t1